MDKSYIDMNEFVKLSRSNEARLNSTLQKIKNHGFDNLETSDFIFLIKSFSGKIIDLSSDKSNFYIARLRKLIITSNIDLFDYSNNDYSTILDESRKLAKEIINLYGKLSNN